jgi:putative peptidoglycan binding protein
MVRMQQSGVRGAARLDEPEDDWLGDVSDYDWSENAAERRHAPSSPDERDAAVYEASRRTPPPAAPAEARRAVVERRRIVAGSVVAAVLGVVVVIALLLWRGGSETPPDQGTTTSPSATSTPSQSPETSTPSTTPSTTTETPAQETPGATQSATPPANGSTFTVPEGTKLRLGEGEPALVKQLQQTLIDAGYDPGAVDGSFGATTEAAVTAFQQDNGLSADGVVGPDTAAALNSAVSGG